MSRDKATAAAPTESVTTRVRAIATGYDNAELRRVGDVFDLARPKGGRLPSWVEEVGPETPITAPGGKGRAKVNAFLAAARGVDDASGSVAPVVTE